jgi:hypothetical protein
MTSIKPTVPIPGPINPQPPQPMSGWKTKLGSFLIAAAGVIGGSAEIAPYPEMVPWIRFIAFIVGGMGSAFLIWGIGHKLEKNRNVLVQKKQIPYYIQKIDPDELALLEELKKRKKGPEPPTV